MMRRLAPGYGYAALAVTLASFYGALLPIVLFSAKWMISVPLILASLFPLVLYLTNNPRLFCLVGMVFTAPLGLSINMRGLGHMGGAHAFSINLMDFFLVPLLVFIARDFYRGERRDVRLSAVSLWWLGLAALGMVNVALGPFRELAAMEVVRMLKLWLLFLVIINECVRVRQFQYVIGALAANAALNFVVAMLQYARKATLGLQPLGEGSELSTEGANLGVYVTSGEVFRVMGLAGHANLYGALLAMYLPIFIGQMYTDSRLGARALLAVISGCSLVALGLTLSRSGWLSFAVSGGLLMVALSVLPGLRHRFLALKVLMIGGAAAAITTGSGMIIRRLTQSDSGALDFRLEWVGIAWDMVKAQPIFGHGLNSWIYNLAEFSPYSVTKMYDLFGDVFPVVHNVYMIVWSEQGTVGLLLFLGLHAHLLWIAIKNLRYRGLSDQTYMLSIAAACGVLAIMVDGLSSFFIRVQAHGRVFWIVAALIVAVNYWNVRNEAVRRQAAARPAVSPAQRVDPVAGTQPQPA